MPYAYYPGCSLGAGEKEYDLSVRAVFAHLGIELHEIEDWNCCGAVHVDANHPDAAVTLPGRNLALAAQQGFETILAPCSGCYKNLRRASKKIAEEDVWRYKVNATLSGGLELTHEVTVMHPLYLLLREYGLPRIKEQIVQPLSELHVASYYGCLLTRPRDQFDSAERPTGLDELMAALGAQTVEFPMKAKCCGGALALSHADVTARLTSKILLSAQDAGADLVALACPMCHTALDGYQGRAAQVSGRKISLPVLFFTQILGLALGIDPAALGLSRHIVSTQRILAQFGGTVR